MTCIVAIKRRLCFSQRQAHHIPNLNHNHMPPPVDNQSPNILDETQVTKFIYPTLFRSGLNYTGDSVCTIDLTGFIDGNSVIITPNCFHIFHTICIDA